MIKGDSARVGIAKVKYFQSFGPAMRAISEEADSLWVLDVFETQEKARLEEMLTWSKFGLPGLIFKHNGQKTGSQEFIDKFYNQLGNNLEKAKKCLSHYGRDFSYPLWTKKEQERFGTLKQNYIGSKKSFVTQSCNLISGAMQVRTFEGSNRGGNWETIQVSREDSNCKVYSLEVEPTEDGKRLYIANNIVTHNSIYMFRGADAQAFNSVQQVLGNAPNGNAPHSLPVNYRSGRKIIQYVNENTHVKDLQAGKDFDGTVTENRPAEEAVSGIVTEKNRGGRLAMQTSFIARTNAPLVRTALDLMSNDVDFVMIGRDFSKELTDHIENVTGKGRNAKVIPINNLDMALIDYVSRMENAWKGKISKEGELKEMKIINDALMDVIEFLKRNNFRDRKLNVQVTNSTTFISYIKQKFSGVNIDDAAEAQKLRERDPLSFVTLTSAHRSKGLEFDRVFILEPQLFPHPKSKTPEALAQEENAKYVAFTRAMKELHVLAPSKEEKKQERNASSKSKKKNGWYVKAKTPKSIKVVEAFITPENLRTLQQMGYQKNEEFFIGPYELYIIGHPGAQMYQLAIQTRNTQAVDIKQQNMKFKMEPDTDPGYINDIKSKIIEWKSKYGDLVIASHNPKKTEKYKNILTYLGFEPRQTNFMGHTLYVI